MRNLKNVLIFSVVLICAYSISNHALAASQKTISMDGKIYTTENKAGQNSSKVVCDNIRANIMAQKINDLSANIMATIVIQSGEQKKAFRLFDLASEDLTSEHDISRMQVGCLSGDGGVGINVPHFLSEKNDVKIQIDSRGRVFLGYDEVGLKIISAK